MTYRAVDEKTISINQKLYRLNGKVRQFLASQRPGKITIGDYTDASNPLASELSWDDFRDGIGVEIADLRTDQNRAWFATTQLRYKGRVILPTRAVSTAAASPAAAGDVLLELKSGIYEDGRAY